MPPTDAPTSALDDPATRAVLRRSTVIAAAGVLLAIGLLVVALLIWTSDRRAVDDLATNGVTTSATVTGIDAQPTGRARVPDGSVNLAFSADGVARTASVYVAGAVTGFQQDQVISVRYLPSDPTDVMIVGQPPTTRSTVPWVVTGGLGLGMAVFGGTAFARLRRMRRLLGRGPWVEVRARREQVAIFRQHAEIVLVLDDPDTRQGLAVRHLGLRSFNATLEPTAWIVGWGTDRPVLATVGGGKLFPAKVVPQSAVESSG